ncbi:DUF805 domain-containing protein [Agreia sp. COWG]|uniref:DUF805 domain-containing protein n=1 Tax=Agreia sp. COWG TaxID=2773266 RepID=UPI0019287893|nr:DUF805 domain-containing protein [Agreia sp. COWG]CAD6008432.1 membrane protein of unknown function [Agreia sp. COWG]
MRYATMQPTMNPGRAIVAVFMKYASFSGRAGLSEFWWFMLFSVVVSAALRVADGFIAGGLDGFELLVGPVYGVFAGQPFAAQPFAVQSPLASVWALFTLLPTLALFIRRLRDGGSTWLQLLWVFVPVAGIVMLVIRFCDPSVRIGDKIVAPAAGDGAAAVDGAAVDGAAVDGAARSRV